MWNPIKSLFFPRPNPAETLLNHFDQLAGREPKFVKVSDEGFQPAIFVAIYRGYPTANAITGFTVGLSHFQSTGGGYKELVISMSDSDDSWALACGYLAYQLRDRCQFVCGDTINFGEQVNNSTGMSAFLVIHPRLITPSNTMIHLDVRRVELVELIPLYQAEYDWINSGGNIESFLQNCPTSVSMNPTRKALAPR